MLCAFVFVFSLVYNFQRVDHMPAPFLLMVLKNSVFHEFSWICHLCDCAFMFMYLMISAFVFVFALVYNFQRVDHLPAHSRHSFPAAAALPSFTNLPSISSSSLHLYLYFTCICVCILLNFYYPQLLWIDYLHSHHSLLLRAAAPSFTNFICALLSFNLVSRPHQSYWSWR